MDTLHSPLSPGKPPILGRSASEAAESLDGQDLSEEDRIYLLEREETIDAGRRTFLEVGKALLEIKEYRDGRLYRRYGTFEQYCQQRWEFGRSYASRIIDATLIYHEMLPRGNNLADGTGPLPTTEKQIRALKKLPPASRLEAWNEAVESAGTRPVLARDVEEQVRKRMLPETSGPPVKAGEQRGPTRSSLQISMENLSKIRSELAKIASWSHTGAQSAKIAAALEQIEKLLPG